jgi:hypothetical protein
MRSEAWFFIAMTLLLAVVAATVVSLLLSTDQPPSGHGSWHTIVCRTDGQTITCPR